MTKKKTPSNKDSDIKDVFDEFEESFFSEGKDTSKIVKKYDLEEDSDDEDFGYSGEVNEHMALDTGEESKISIDHTISKVVDVVDVNIEVSQDFEKQIEQSLDDEFADDEFGNDEFSEEESSEVEVSRTLTENKSLRKLADLEIDELADTLDMLIDDKSLFAEDENSDDDDNDQSAFFTLSEDTGIFDKETDEDLEDLVFFNPEDDSPEIDFDEGVQEDIASAQLDDLFDNDDGLNIDLDTLEEIFVPLSDEEFYRKRRELLEGEAKLHPITNSIWVECARYSWHNLRENDRALFFYEKAKENGVLRNEEIRAYSTAVARTKKVGRFVELLQEWAQGREGALASEAWNDISIFFWKTLGRLDLALKASEKAVETDPENWLGHQLICQLQEQQEHWDDLLISLERMKVLSVGVMRSQIVWQQGMVALGKLSQKETALGYFKEAITDDPNNFQMILILKKIALSLNEDELFSTLIGDVVDNLDGEDQLFWALREAFLLDGREDRLLAVLEKNLDPELFWFRLALLKETLPAEEQVQVQIKLLEEWISEQEDDETLALAWFKLAELRKKDSQDSYIDALLKTLDLDPSAIIVVDDYIDVLLAEERYEACVKWLLDISERVADKSPGIAIAYLIQAAFISDLHLDDSSLISRMLSETDIDDASLAYLSEIVYLRNEDWGRLISFYKAQAQKVASNEEAAHCLIQAAKIAENNLNQPEQAEELYGLAMERSNTAYVGITDILRLQIRSGDWTKIVSLLQQKATQVLHPASTFYVAANISHCLLQNERLTRANIEACLEVDPNHVSALLLLRKLDTDIQKRIDVSQRLKENIDDASMSKWLELEIAILEEEQGNIGSISDVENCFDLDRLYFHLKSKKDPKEVLSLFGKNRYFDMLLMASDAVRKSPSLLKSIGNRDALGFGVGLWLEDIGRFEQALSVYGENTSYQAKLQNIRLFEQQKSFDQALVVLEDLFKDNDSDVRILLKMEKILRMKPSRHTTLAKVVGALAEELETPSTANYYALLGGQLFEHLGETKQSETFYLQAFQYKPILGKAFAGLRTIYIQTHDIETMEQLFQRVNQPVLLEYSETMEEFRAFHRAVAGYEKLVELSEDVPLHDLIPYYSRIERCYEKIGAWAEVLSTIETNLKHIQSMSFQEHLTAKRRWILLEHLSDTDLALETYQKMLEEDPQDREVLQSLARIAIQHNQIEQAIEYLERLSLDPLNALEASRIQRTLAEAYNAQGNIEKEKEALQAALDLDGTDLQTFAVLGQLYRRIEGWNDLIALLAREFQVRKDPDRLGCRKEIAQIAEEQLQNYELALEEWLKVHEIVGGDREILRSLTSLCLKMEDYEGYIRYSTELLEILNTEDASVLCLAIANIYANELMEEGKAVQYWEKSLEGEATFQEASEHLEANYLLLGEWQKLYDLLLRQQDAETDVDKRVATLLRIAEIAETSLMNNELSKEAFDIILEIDPQNMNAIQKRSQHLYQTKAWGDLVSLYSDSEQRYLSGGSSFEQKQEQLQFYYQFAEALIALEEEDAAIQKLERALQINPSHMSSLKLLAGVCFKIENWVEAYEKYHRLLLLVDGSSDASILWKIYFNLGFCALRLGEVDKAVGYYQKSRLRNPSSLLTLRGLAECNFVKEEYSRAAQLCSNIVEQAVEADDVVFGFGFRGFLLETKFKKLKLAKQHYLRALEFEIQQPIFLLRLASLSIQEKSWAEAEESLNKGLASVDKTPKIEELYQLASSVVEKQDLLGEEYEILNQALREWNFY